MAFKKISTWIPHIQAQFGGGGDGKPTEKKWERSITDDGTAEVNFANAICDLTNPASGVSLNTNSSATAPTNFRERTFDSNAKVLFKSNFTAGFDNFYDWALAFGGIFQTVDRDLSAMSLGDAVGPAVIADGRLPIMIDADGLDGDVHQIISNHYLKIPSSGRTSIELSGVFQHQGLTTNTTLISLEISGSLGVNDFPQGSWNIDTFGAGVLNPSGITLDFTKIQALVIELTNRDHGNPKVGFLIGNIIYFAHEFENNNEVNIFNFGNLNLPITDRSTRSLNTITKKTGIYNGIQGISLVSTMDTTNEPFMLANYFMNSCVAYTEGASDIDFRSPFSTGTSDILGNYVTVSGIDTFLFSVRPKLEMYAGVINRTVFNIDNIKISTKNPDLQFAALIRVFWNPLLSGETYLSINNYSALELNLTYGGSNLFNSILIASVIVHANQDITLTKEDILKEYKNAFSIKETVFGGAGITDLNRGTIAVFASPMPGTTTIDVSVNINGGEIA